MLIFFFFTFVRKKCLKDTHVNKRSEAVIPQFMDYVTKIILSASRWLFALDAAVETISYIDRLPNEILQKILTEALLFSGFSRPSHVCQT